tara:strand:+ start:12866 stop:12973 length:108 start_codon:yes stop_codon:yes gene_type:complete
MPEYLAKDFCPMGDKEFSLKRGMAHVRLIFQQGIK